MATVKDVKGIKGFCDDVYTELAGMKKRLSDLRDSADKNGGKNDVIVRYGRHLAELIDEIDWKIQILAHVCPYEWKGSREFENDVRVNPTENEFSPGYLGG